MEDVAAGAGAAAAALDTAGVQAIVEGNHFFYFVDFSCKLTFKFYCPTLNAAYISLW